MCRTAALLRCCEHETQDPASTMEEPSERVRCSRLIAVPDIIGIYMHHIFKERSCLPIALHATSITPQNAVPRHESVSFMEQNATTCSPTTVAAAAAHCA